MSYLRKSDRLNSKKHANSCTETYSTNGSMKEQTYHQYSEHSSTNYSNASTLLKHHTVEPMDYEDEVEPFYEYGYVNPINKSSLKSLCGKNKGIQGRGNSCYLDATLFAMFAFTDTFDSLLLRPDRSENSDECKNFRTFLREGVVNVLRRSFTVKSKQIGHVRNLLNSFDSSGGFLDKERDPEEVLNLIFTKLLPIEPFLSFSSNNGTHIFELIPSNPSEFSFSETNVQMLLEQSFYFNKLFLDKTPSVLILQLPRISKSKRMFNEIIPSCELNITPLVKTAPQSCAICSKLASFYVEEAFNIYKKGFLDTYYCDTCVIKRGDSFQKQCLDTTSFKMLHKENLVNRAAIKMELFAVLCIQTSHYVCYARCENEWVYFNSMADQQKNINVPEVIHLPNLNESMKEVSGIKNKARSKTLGQSYGFEEVDLSLKNLNRIKTDAYICFYRNPALTNYI